MTIMLFLSDDFEWTNEKMQCIFNYLCKYSKTDKTIILLNNKKFLNKVNSLVNCIKTTNNNIKLELMPTIKNYVLFLKTSNLLLIDKLLKYVVGVKIPYCYDGEFFYI